MAQQTSFQSVLNSLLETEKDIPLRSLTFFSDIDPDSLKDFLEVWPRISPPRKLLLLDQLLILLDSDTLVSFDDTARALLNDADGEVRARVLRLLAESDDPKLVPTFISILKNDKELAPRIEAATLLGEFVRLGELDELPERLHRDAENSLLAIESGDEKPGLRRRALESLGYSERPEAATVIESAFHRQDPEWKTSALIAMGRSNDAERWEDSVLSMLLSEDPRTRHAAVEAAGELRLDSARTILLGMMDDEDDDEVISAIIWSLSQIGGDDVRIFLLDLVDKSEDEDLTEFLEDALSNLDFTEELDRFDLLSLDGDEDLMDMEEEDEEDER